MRIIRATLALGAALLVLPAASMAASTTSTVSGTIGAELSLSASTPGAMVLTHAAPATTTSLVTVTSTQPSWTLSIKDAAVSNPGHMVKLGAPTSVLENALQWSNDGTTFSDLSGTAATVKSGALVDTANVTFKQSLGSTEDLAQGDVYNLVATYTVT